MLSVSEQALHAALYRSINSLLTWSSLGTLQGLLVCYCECGSASVQVTAVSWILSVSAQAFDAALYRSINSLLTWSSLGTVRGWLVCYCECGSPSVQVTAVSWMLSVSAQALHAAMYRSIYILLTWSSLGTLQGLLLCYCECGSPSVRVTAVSWMLSVSALALHAALYRSIYSLLTWFSLGTLQGLLLCYCECGIPSVQVTAVSWMLPVSAQALHAALYRSIYSLLTGSSLGTVRGFLGAFAKFLGATVSFVMSDCPSVFM